MPKFSFAQSNFSGGAWSGVMAGRMDDPRYKTAVALMHNYMPNSETAIVRRPGWRVRALARGGAAAKLLSWKFSDVSAFMGEFGDANLRFWTANGAVSNDLVVVTDISTDNPAVITLEPSVPAGWLDGDYVVFSFTDLASMAYAPSLAGRQFSIEIVTAAHWSNATTYATGDTVTYNGATYTSLQNGNINHKPPQAPTFWEGTAVTQVTLVDPATGDPVDGTAFGGSFTGASLLRILDVPAPWTEDEIAALRKVQSMQVNADRGLAESRVTFLHGEVQPHSLTNLQAFTDGLIPELFFDGPYLDPPTDPVPATPSDTTGVIQLTFSDVPGAWDSGTTYDRGDVVSFVKDGDIRFSLSINGSNLNHNPAAPGADAYWIPEPSPWSSILIYGEGDVVTFEGLVLYSRVSSNTGNQPDTHPQDWSLEAPAWVFQDAAISDYPSHVTFNGAIWKANTFFGGTDGPPSDGTDEWYRVRYSIFTERFPGVNDGNGFSSLDIGRCIRLLCGPAPWDGATTYTSGDQVVFNGLTYQAKAASTGIEPDTNLSLWTFLGPGIAWRWGRIVFVYSQTTDDIDPWSAGSYSVGDTFAWGENAGVTNIYTDAYMSLADSNTSSPPEDGQSSADWLHIGSFVDFDVIPRLVAPLWISTKTYNKGDLVNDGTTSAVYAALVDRLGSGDVPGVSDNWFPLTGVTLTVTGSPNSIYVEIIDEDLPSTDPIYSWRLGLYSDASGWPRAGYYHEGRLWFAGPVKNRWDASMTNVEPGLGGLFRFSPTNSDGSVADNSAISDLVNFADQNDIYGFGASSNGLVAFTLSGPILIAASSFDDPITPTSQQVRRATNIGAYDAEVQEVPSANVFIHSRRRRIMEHRLFVDTSSSSQTYDAVDLVQPAKNLTEGIAAELAFQTDRLPILWCRNDDGTLFGIGYKRDPEQKYTAPFSTDHGAGRSFTSLAVLPNAEFTNENLWSVTVDSDDLHYIETMADVLDEDAPIAEFYIVDGGVAPAGALWVDNSTDFCLIRLFGLWSLVGQTVAVFIGSDYGDFLVSADGTLDIQLTATTAPLIVAAVSVNDGAIFGLPTETTAVDFTGAPFAGDLPPIIEPQFYQLTCAIGFPYNSDGQLLRPLEGGANGPSFAKLRRIQKAAIQYFRIHELSWGTDFTNLRPLKLSSPGGTPIGATDLRTGVYRDTLESKADFDTQIAWRQSRPWPGVILVVGGFSDVVDI